MSTFQAVYASVTLISLVSGVASFLVDGMLLWSIGFFVLGIMLVLFRMIWEISGWADKQTKRYFD